MIDVARSRAGPAIAWGLAMAVGLPIVSVLVLFTLVGIPLGLMGLLSLALLYGLGYSLAALFLGRALIKEPRGPVLAFCLGLLILRVVDLIPVLGNLVTFAATVFGLGALTVAAWRAARGSPAAASRTAQRRRNRDSGRPVTPRSSSGEQPAGFGSSGATPSPRSRAIDVTNSRSRSGPPKVTSLGFAIGRSTTRSSPAAV